MTLLPITLTIAGACGFLTIWLAVRVILTARRGGSDEAADGALLARKRAHANFAEYAPFFLILVALIELAGDGGTLLWLTGATFVLVRVAHAVGMDRPGANAYRVVGFGGTILLLGGLALYAVAIPYMRAASGPTVSG